MQLFTHVFLFRQTVSEWSGSNAVVHSCVPVQTNIGYCHMFDGSPTEFSTVYTVMKNVQSMMTLLGQNYICRWHLCKGQGDPMETTTRV